MEKDKMTFPTLETRGVCTTHAPRLRPSLCPLNGLGCKVLAPVFLSSGPWGSLKQHTVSQFTCAVLSPLALQ
jgi:hypothetical protein